MSAELIAQLVNPDDAGLSAGSNTKVWWRCTDDPRHVWQAAPNTRRRSPGCPVCQNKLVLAGINDVASTHPELAAQLVDASVGETVHAGSHKKVLWSCENPEHPIWEASVVSRVRSGAGCPYCSGRKAVPGVNDLATLKPEYAARLVNPQDAVGVPVGSGKKLEWLCHCGKKHTWQAAPHSRLKSALDGGCPLCSNRWGTKKSQRIRRGTVKDERPDVLADAVKPEMVENLSIGSGKDALWRCDEGHEFAMSVRKKVAGQGCPVCSGKQVVPGINDLATTHPDIAAQLVDKHMGYNVSRGSEKVCTWRCEKDHVWDVPVYARVAGNGCPQCNSVGTSGIEQRLYKAVLVLDEQAKHRARVNGVEYDIVAGDLAIEVNGLYWHSEAAGKSKNYHAEKSDAACQSGLSLMHVWEDQLHEKPALALRSIAYKMNALDHYEDSCAVYGVKALRHGVYNARELDVCELSVSQANSFYEQHHLQGVAVCTVNLALRDENDGIVAVLGLRAPGSDGRVSSRDDSQWEIRRYATAGVVRGGFSKLLSAAEKMLGDTVSSWVTFSSRDVSDGRLYESTGFDKDGVIAPDYWYTGGICRNKRAVKQSFSKKRFREDQRLVFDEGWTEHEAALRNGLIRVYDAGKTRWVKKVA